MRWSDEARVLAGNFSLVSSPLPRFQSVGHSEGFSAYDGCMIAT